MKHFAIHKLSKTQPSLLTKVSDRLCCGDMDSAVYFYHSDHLGSASWITNGSGTPIQHLQYMPYGEPFVNERTTGYEERFTFTGKERDSETGFSYFGARYYDSDLMTAWLSVDPMADKYPSLSPYAYCAWNPVKLVDPDGRMMDEPQRRAAIAKAKEYEMANRVDKTKPSGKGNSKNTYGYAKGKPGQIVDCSGLVSECIMAGGEENPVGKYPGGGGVKQIAKGTEKLSNTNLAEEGNLIIFNDQSHVGIIVGINYENEEITSFTIIHSSGRPERGYSGPNYTTIPIEGSKYWKIDGVYKWDTKPDYLINLNEVKIIDNRITKTDEK